MQGRPPTPRHPGGRAKGPAETAGVHKTAGYKTADIFLDFRLGFFVRANLLLAQKMTGGMTEG